MLIKKERIIDLTLALYKVTDFLPKEEVLRQKMREAGNDVLDGLFCSNSEDTEVKINLLIAYFQVAMAQNWLDEKNFLVMKREYTSIKQKINVSEEQKTKEIEPKPVKVRQKTDNPAKKPKKTVSSGNSRNKRQDRIFELMQNQGKITLEELKNELSQVCPRTLRRDIGDLLEKNVIQRIRKSKKDVLFVLNTKDSGQNSLE